MNMNGKILFFNNSDGVGTIISKEKEKINFSVDNWNDFDVMPSAGLEICFDYINFKASSIMSIITKNSSDNSSNKHFVKQENITALEDIENDFSKKKKSVKATLNIPKSISNYFDIINDNIKQRTSYKKVPGRLDYLVVRRFLWTTFNNLSEIDLNILTPDIKALNKDLKNMTGIYDDFINKTKFPVLAYEEVFLACQIEYLDIKDDTQKMIDRLNQLRVSEEQLGKVLAQKKKELKKKVKSPEFEELKREYKVLNGTYVDMIHMMGELNERYKHDIELVTNFEKKFKHDFYKLFGDEAKKYKDNIVEILSAQAFLLDSKLWKQAKSSKVVKEHFYKAGVRDDLNTKTYLKYYLDTLDSNKTGEETQKLFELFDYLTEIHKESIMVVVSSAQDAMEYEADIKKTDRTYNAKAFIDEKLALQWAIKNNVKVLVIEDKLAKLQLPTFLKHYKKLVSTSPKIILLGRDSKTNIYTINKVLSKGVSPRVISTNVQKLLSQTTP